MKRKAAYKIFLDKYGLENELIMAIEEMSELSKELCKYIRNYKSDNTPRKIEETERNIREEIADVLNCVEPLMDVFGAEEIERVRDEKLQRGMERMKS